jgi:type IV secretory pathway TrbD component
MSETGHNDSEPVEDFSTASVDIALQEPRTILRVERGLFHINLALGLIVITVIRIWQVASVQVLLVHVVAMWFSRRQPDRIAIYLRYRKQADIYRPWLSESKTHWVRNRRPEGFGRI